MKFEWYLAKRYFRGQRQESRFLSFIKIMAITGVAVGSAGLLIALSIVHGFKSVINEKVTGFDSHIIVSSLSGDPIFRADTLETYLYRFDDIETVQPVVNGQIMVQSRTDISGTLIKGVHPDGDVTDLGSFITEGSYDLGLNENNLPGIILGRTLARNIGAEIGSTVTGFRVEGIPTPLNPPDLMQFYLSGIYQTGIERLDDGLAVVDIQYARNLFGMGPLQATDIDIRVRDPGRIQQVYDEVIVDLPYAFSVESIFQRYRNIFAWVDLQEQTIPFVISVMVIIAAFNLIGTVLMMVLERVRDIGILKTMGAKSRSILRIFLLEGLFVGGAGLVIGMGIAMLFNWIQGTWQVIPLSEENYYMSYAPVEPHALDFFIVAGITIILCALASWLPARVAARTDPVKVLVFGN